MEACLLELRSDIERINPFHHHTSGSKRKFTKTGRLKAVLSIRDALSRKHVIAALTAVSRQEMIRGPTDDTCKPLGWAELSCVMLLTLDEVCRENVKSRTSSRSGSVNMRPEFMSCFRSILKLSLQHGPRGVLRHLVRPFLSYAHLWLTEPLVRGIFADQIWQCARELLQDEVNRALLLPADIERWVDACFEQLTGRGALRHSSNVVTNIAGEVLQILASTVDSYDTLSQHKKGASQNMTAECDFGYCVIAERCCMMLIVAEGMSRRKAREIQSVAFRTLSIVLSDHALDFLGSNALQSIINATLKPLLACWSEKKYNNAAVSLCKVLILLAPTDKQLTDTIRHRVLVDLREESSSATIRSGQEISTQYIDTAAGCFTFCECLEFAGAAETHPGVVTLWLRTAHTIISGRILKHGTTVSAEVADVLDQCSKAARTVTEILKRHGNLREHDYLSLIHWSTMTINVAAVIAESIHSNGVHLTAFAKSSWQDLYKELREHAMKAKYSVRSRGPCLNVREPSFQAEDMILQTLGLLCGLELLDSATLDYTGVNGNHVGSLPYPASRLLPTSGVRTTRYEIEYFRNLVCRTGLVGDTVGHVRFQLISTLLNICRDEQEFPSTQAKLLEEASASALALVRGECGPSDKSTVFHKSRLSISSFSLIALHSFQGFYGLRCCSKKIVGEGSRLVRRVAEQDVMWKDSAEWSPQASILASSATQAVISCFDAASSKDAPKVSLSRHFVIDTLQTDSLEKELLKMLQDMGTGVAISRRTESSSCRPDDSQGNSPKDDVGVGEINLFHEGRKLGMGLRTLIFLSYYLLHGMRLGLISISKPDEASKDGMPEKLGALLNHVVLSTAKANPEHLISKFRLTEEAIRVSSRLLHILDTDHHAHSCESPQSIWSKLSQTLSSWINCLVTSVSTRLFHNFEEQTLRSVKLIQNLAQDDFLDLSEIPKSTDNGKRRRNSGKTARGLQKRRRTGSVTFSEESNESNGTGDSDLCLEEMAETQGKKLDHHSDDSDDLRGFASDDDDKFFRARTRSWSHWSEKSDSFWRKGFSIVEVAVREFSTCRECVLETFIIGLRGIDDVERALSPDGFERAALLSPYVSPSILEYRRSAWNVLLTIGTGNAVATVARDLLKVGKRWKRLELTAHGYISFYADLLEIGKGKQYPVLPDIEASRVIFLDTSCSLFEKASQSDFTNRSPQTQHPESEICRLIGEIVGVSEYFRNRHAFRMPRITRITYIRFGCSFVNLARCILSKASGHNLAALEETSLIELSRSLQVNLRKFLMDEECIVRVVASRIVPKIIVRRDYSENEDLEWILDNSLPQADACDDCSEYYGQAAHVTQDETNGPNFPTWNLSSTEHNACVSIHKSFRRLGASGKGYSTFMTLSEIAANCEQLIPYCVIQMINRVTRNNHFLVCAYHVLVRLCAALNYRSPHHFYVAYARIVLPKWFETQGSTEGLYKFPASLFVDRDHHKEGILYDWIRENQTSLLPHILVQERALSLDLTVRFAEVLQEDPASLLKGNVTAFALLYPMQFTGGLYERGKLLWRAVDSRLKGTAMALMSEKKFDVIDAFLRSVSTNWEYPPMNDRLRAESREKLGFTRDTRSVKPPFYDPLVIALAINHLFASDCNVFIVQRTVLRGSLFAEVRDKQTGVVLADRFVDFLRDCQRTNVTLLRVLVSTLTCFEEPPSSQPKRSRVDAFFCVGMLWRMLDDAMLVKSKNERSAFYKLIARGFQYEETALDAMWLLSDVQAKLANLQERYPDFTVSESDAGIEHSANCCPSMTGTKERQMFELLSTVSPVLVVIMVKADNSYDSNLHKTASRALQGLMSLCSQKELWLTILFNGPFPRDKQFKDARKAYEKARSLVEIVPSGDKVDNLLSCMARFKGMYKRLGSSETSVNIRACLQEMYTLLGETTVNKLSKKIKSEAWLRSNGMEEQIVPQINGTLSCLVDMVYKSSTSSLREKDLHFPSSCSKGSYREDGEGEEGLSHSLLREVTRVLSVLGLLHPQTAPFVQAETYYKSIPARQVFEGYEEVESGIRLSLHLLQDLLQSNLSLQAQIALNTLVSVLKSPDGKRVYTKWKELFEHLVGFRTTERSLQTNELATVSFPDHVTGNKLSPSVLPELRSSALWSLPSGEVIDEYSFWMRRLCTVLASNCRSNALKALTSACFASYRVSCEMFPYLLMDIICDLDDASRSDISKLLRHHVLLNRKTPVSLLREFVHALDVLCQIGLDVVSSKGVLAWVGSVGQSHGFPYYYVLEIPYVEAAKAALKSGAYFSVLRYAQLYIDHKLTKVEVKQSTGTGSNHRVERRFSSCPLRDPAVENAEQIAKEKVIPLVREALIQLSEPDGVRAFGENGSMVKSVANIAALDGDWSRSLSALDVSCRNVRLSIPTASQALEDHGEENGWNSACAFDFRKELEVFRSFIGLGTIHIAVDYWDGLRNRMVRKIGEAEESDPGENRDSYLNQLNELRYAAAWKLQQWESPSLLPQSETHRPGDRTSSHGFHEAIYLSLRSLRTGHFEEVSGIISRARNTVLCNLRDGSSTISAKSVFENASRLYVCNVLERAASQSIIPTFHITNAVGARVLSNREKDSSNYSFPSQSCNAAGSGDAAAVTESLDHFTNQHVENEDVICQVLGDNYGVDDKVFRDGLILSRDSFHSGILTEDLPVVLARCMKRNTTVANVSATISARILSEGGVGAWPRATSCLGTTKSSLLEAAPQKDVIAWKLQETRLKWLANYDAISKKQALAAVKDIISNNLGGKALDKTTDDISDSPSFQQSLTWQRGDIDEETLAFLRSEACCMAAQWSLEMNTHEPMDLFQMYLESGLTAASKASEDSQLVGRAHFAMASFADAQINNIDSYRKSRTYDWMVSTVKEMEQKIENLKRMKAERLSKTRSQRKTARKSSRSSRSDATSEAVTEKKLGRDLDNLIRMEQKKAMQDRARLEKLDDTYQKWQMLACRHFASSLCNGSTQDLRAAFRMVAIWLDAGPMRNKITMALVDGARKSSAGNRGLVVPVSKLLPLAPQLASRLNKCENIGDTTFQDSLSNTITEMAGEFPAHCLWQLLALSNATRDSGSQEKYSSLYRGDKDKKDAADEILDRLQHRHGDTVMEMKKVANAYIILSETSSKLKGDQKSLDLRSYEISRLGELSHVPVPTVPIPLDGTDHMQRIPHMMGFERKAGVCAGLSKPLRVVCVGSDGNLYPQMVKGKDDLRGDAVMEQMFTILNSLFEKDEEAARRSLHIRTYRVIPLSPFSGIMQFVSNTKQFREVLVERDSGANGKQSRTPLHERYHPKDHKHTEIQQRAFRYLKMPGGGPHKVVQFLASAWHRFQPAFRYFFVEEWPDPAEWFSHHLSYSRSVAVMSMVGFILGLGDRHLCNILLDVSTAEVVHIDFGIAFEQGKLLPTPEHMPFRLTRDLVDGCGITGVEGVFRRCSEITLSVMRRNKDVMLTVIQVLLHDPMYSWALTPEEVLREQNRPQRSEDDCFESNELSRSFGDSSVEAVARTVNKKMNGSRDAQRALNRISEKLDGLEGTERLTIEAHVARLIDEAQAFHVIAPVYPGWAPWL